MSLFREWKNILSILVCIISLIIAAPNFYNSNSKFLQDRKLNLGLDLSGGSQLLLKTNFESYIDDQLELLIPDIKTILNKNKIYLSKLRVEENRIKFNLKELNNDINWKEIFGNMYNFLDVSKKDYEVVINYNESFLIDLKKTVIDQSIEIIRRRVDETGVREPSIQEQGSDYILLQVPGLENPSQLKKMLGQTAKLSFHLVDNTNLLNNHEVTKLPSYLEFLTYDKNTSNGVVIRKKASMSGDSVSNAKSIIIQNNKPVVSLSLNPIGSKQFSEITRNNIGKALAIILDKKIISVAVINEHIAGGSSIISGNFTLESANELALLLRAGALPAPIEIEEERVVGPNLGNDSIKAGKISAVISALMIITFMTLTYGMLGIFANIALLINIILIIASLSLLQATLTMPGIAGLILTMGMAVDANVLIFERIREELKSGANNIIAVERGFRQAFTTIFDSNITTIIVAFLLYIYGSGAIKGFAVTLSIGIICSMFSAITLTKIMIFSWLRSTKIRKLKI